MAHGPSCSTACGILPDQGSNPCPLHWQADSQPLHHQGSPQPLFINAHNSVGHLGGSSNVDQAPDLGWAPSRSAVCAGSTRGWLVYVASVWMAGLYLRGSLSLQQYSPDLSTAHRQILRESGSMQSLLRLRLGAGTAYLLLQSFCQSKAQAPFEGRCCKVILLKGMDTGE